LAEERNLPHTFENMGLLLSRPGDAISPNHFTIFKNMESFRTGYIQNRQGSIEIGTEASVTPVLFAAAVHSMGFYLQYPEGFPTDVYFGAGTDLIYRQNGPLTTLQSTDYVKFTGNPMVMDSYKIFNSFDPWEIVFDLNKRVKAQDANVYSFGIAEPTKLATAAVSGAGLLNGSYDWVYQYRNLNTGSVSPLSPIMAAQLATVNQAVDVTVQHPTDPQVTHIDLYRAGGTLAGTYLFVKTITATTFGGAVVINDNIADSGLGTEVTTLQIPFSNILGVATTVRKTTDNGATYTNYTTNASDNNAATEVDISSLDTLANGDWLVVGSDVQHRKLMIGMDAAVNSNASVMTVQYWNGTAWSNVASLKDGTALSGKTFGQSGIVTFKAPLDWVQNTVDTVLAYHIRFIVSAALDATVKIDEIRISSSPIDADVFTIHKDRVWVNDLNNMDRLWFSQRIRVEEFRLDNFIMVGQGSDRVRRPISVDDQMLCLTDNTVYRILGGDELSFEADKTGAPHGLYARYAIAVGMGRVFYRAYDAVYAMSSTGETQKVTESFDQLFRGIAGGSDVTQAAFFNSFNQLDYERLQYYDNKLYWSYKTSAGTRFELIYDFITERWTQTDRKVTCYLPVPYQGRLYSAHEDLYVYHRNVGTQDVAASGAVDISMDFRAAYLNFDTPEQDKNFVELVLDLDTGGAAFSVQLDFENGDFSTTYAITAATGRRLIWMPINLGIGIFAKNVGFRITTLNQNTSIKFYKVNFNFWVEPRELNKTSWDWSDYGTPDRKYFKQLVVDMDTQGASADVLVYLDGDTHCIGYPNPTFANVQTTTRQRVVLSLPIDTEGKIAKVHVKSSRQYWQVKVYGHYFNYIANGLEVGKNQTEWKDWGWPADKRWRQLMIDINTFGKDMQLSPEFDGAAAETFTVNTPGRRLITHSMPPNTLGKLERLVFNR